MTIPLRIVAEEFRLVVTLREGPDEMLDSALSAFWARAERRGACASIEMSAVDSRLGFLRRVVSSQAECDCAITFLRSVIAARKLSERCRGDTTPVEV